MAQSLCELVERFCTYQAKQRGKAKGGVQTYRWNLSHFLRFVQKQKARAACVEDVSGPVIQSWLDDMAGQNLAISTLRTRQSTLSSFASWLVKRGVLEVNPVAKLDRPPHHRQPPQQVPSGELMDELIRAARKRGRSRDVAIFLILRYTGMRRESVASLRVRNLAADWGLRGVPVKGGKTRDIPLPEVVRQYLRQYVENVVAKESDPLTADTPIFWSTYGRRHLGTIRRPMTGKNVWRLCKVYGKDIGYPQLKPHDLRHGVAMEVYSEHHDLEQVRALLGHTRIETTQVYAQIQPRQLKQAVSFYEAKALEVLS